MRRVWKSLAWTFGILGGLVLVLVVLAGGYLLWLSQSVPDRDGAVALTGLSQPVQVVRDREDVVYIEASDQADAYFALGFVHAQERLWQMDVYRRIAGGRLAEVVGPMAADADAFMRTLGLYRAAAADVDHLDPPVAAAVEAYVAGVNAYMDHHSGPWPPEFGLLFYEPEPWSAADSLAMGKLLGLMLTGNWQRELTRAALLQRLAPEQVDFLMQERHPDPDAAAAVPQERSALDEGLGRLAAAVTGASLEMPAWFRLGGASAAWVLSGERTATGRPILASDPHLAFTAPGIWYLARVRAVGIPDDPDPALRPLDLTGATTPGIPFHLLGQNGRVAWGATTAYGDAADLYLERIAPGDPERYDTPAGPEPFTVRQERVEVRFGSARDLTVRETRHGPVISDVQSRAGRVTGEGLVLALNHPVLIPQDSSTRAIYRLQFARDVGEVQEALADLVAPMQNFLFADVEGGIGFVSAGWLPLRQDHDGRLPARGWEMAAPPTEPIPVAALPHVMMPEEGIIFNANNSMERPGDPHSLGDGYDLRYRADRIAELLTVDEPHDLARSAAMQTDTLSLMARELRPLLLAELAQPGATDPGPADPDAEAALAILRGWNDHMDADSPAPLIFIAWMRQVNRALFEDELGSDFRGWWDLRPVQVANVLRGAGEWCNDIRTDRTESCAAQVAAALDAALADLRERFGPDPRAWRWSAAHQVTFRHPLFGFVPFLDRILDTRAPAQGGNYTLDRGGMSIGSDRDPFAKVHGAGYRAVYDLGDLDASLYSIVPGQSGNPFERAFADKVEGWVSGRYFHIPAELPPGQERHRMSLEPR